MTPNQKSVSHFEEKENQGFEERKSNRDLTDNSQHSQLCSNVENTNGNDYFENSLTMNSQKIHDINQKIDTNNDEKLMNKETNENIIASSAKNQNYENKKINYKTYSSLFQERQNDRENFQLQLKLIPRLSPIEEEIEDLENSSRKPIEIKIAASASKNETDLNEIRRLTKEFGIELDHSFYEQFEMQTKYKVNEHVKPTRNDVINKTFDVSQGNVIDYLAIKDIIVQDNVVLKAKRLVEVQCGSCEDPSGLVKDKSGTAVDPSGTVENPSGSVKDQFGFDKDQTGLVQHLSREISKHRSVLTADQHARLVEDQSGSIKDQSGSIKDQSGFIEDQQGLAKIQSGLVEDQHGLAKIQSGLVGDQQVLAEIQSGLVGDQQVLAEIQSGLVGDQQGLSEIHSGLVKAVIRDTPNEAYKGVSFDDDDEEIELDQVHLEEDKRLAEVQAAMCSLKTNFFLSLLFVFAFLLLLIPSEFWCQFH
jgi:hypothetical protein